MTTDNHDYAAALSAMKKMEWCDASCDGSVSAGYDCDDASDFTTKYRFEIRAALERAQQAQEVDAQGFFLCLSEEHSGNYAEAFRIYEALNRAGYLQNPNQWQPIETNEFYSGKRFLLIDEQQIPFIGWRTYPKIWSTFGHSNINPTHWMPLPQPPKGKDDE